MPTLANSICNGEDSVFLPYDEERDKNDYFLSSIHYCTSVSTLGNKSSKGNQRHPDDKRSKLILLADNMNNKKELANSN